MIVNGPTRARVASIAPFGPAHSDHSDQWMNAPGDARVVTGPQAGRRAAEESAARRRERAGGAR